MYFHRIVQPQNLDAAFDKLNEIGAELVSVQQLLDGTYLFVVKNGNGTI